MMRLVVRILLLVVSLLLLFVPLFITSISGMHRLNAKIVKAGFRCGCLILGIEVWIEGIICDNAPLLLISNHFSYLDVFVLGSLVGQRFTPKSDVASWPIIGFFCKITGCIFIDRRPSRTKENMHKLEDAIKQSSVISLFPEGTTNDGTALLPFKSSYFSIAENHDVAIQPVSISYTHLNGEPVTLRNRHIIGWYGDMEFFPHFIEYLKQPSLYVNVIFHAPLNGKNFSTRKEMAAYCQNIINASLSYY